MIPLVSILVTAFNREKYIAECLESILNSTFQDFEIIIVDDQSTDATVQICNQIKERDNRITLVVNEKNIGQFANRNKAASLARGKYIKYVDSDDTLFPHALEVMVKGMEYNNAAFLGIEYNVSDPLVGKKTFPFLLNPSEAFLWHFEKGGLLYPGPSACIYNRQAFSSINGFNEKLGINSDVYLNLTLASLGDTLVLPTGLINWRRHDNQVNVGQEDLFKMIQERFIIHKTALFDNTCPLNVKAKKRIYLSQKILYIRKVLSQFLLKGKIYKAYKLLSNSLVPYHNIPMAFFPIRLLKRNNY